MTYNKEILFDSVYRVMEYTYGKDLWLINELEYEHIIMLETY